MSSTSLAIDGAISPRQVMIFRMRRHRGLLVGMFIISTITVLAIFAPFIVAHGPFEQFLEKRLLPPVWDKNGVWTHLLGTDHLGRDYFSRLLYGTRVSLVIGVGAAFIGSLIGVTLGVCAGYFGGRVDQVINYILTCQLALPGLLLIMSLVFLIGPSVTVVIVVIGALHWTYYLVVTRAATMKIRQLDYIAAARSIGSSRRQIITHEILPNVFNHIIVVFTLEVGIAILSEASLSFLGVGVPAPTPSWGLMIAEGKQFMFFRPWLVVFPGIALFLIVISVNLLGDGIRDITAPDGHN